MGEVALDPLFDLRVGHVLDVLRELPSNSVHCVVTSPPYFALREYETPPVEWPDGWVGELGLEPTPGLYVEHMVEVFREVRRVLRGDGSLWLNLGDTYEKGELLGIPWRVAFALGDDGWVRRSECVWRKLGGMPESVFTRPGREHEHVFMLTKPGRYFYDPDGDRVPYVKDNRKKTTVKAGPNSIQHRDGERWPHPDGRLMRTVWDFPTADYPGAHFAVFPDELPERCIRLGTSEQGCCSACGAPWVRIVEADGESVVERQARQSVKTRALSIAPRSDGGALQQGVSVAPAGARERKTVGWEPTCECVDEEQLPGGEWSAPLLKERVPCVVLDPFVGSGTTMVAARRLDRASVGIELSERYAREETTRRLSEWYKDVSRIRDVVIDGQLSMIGEQ